MKENLRDWLTIGSNIGVFLGLILLIIEISQNSEITRVQIEQTRSDTYVNWLRESADSEYIAPLIGKLQSDTSSPTISPTEKVRLDRIVAARYFDYEHLYFQYQDGYVGKEYWDQRITPGILEWGPRWIERGFTNGRAEFNAEVDRILHLSE